MRLNDDLSVRTLIRTSEMAWTPSPMPGVERRMLYRIGEEAARATSIVRYAAGSRFSAHDHPGGEEILVLEGVFQDGCGNYPAGTYIRNPPGSRHEPASEKGCTILVKLRQFGPGDHRPVVRMPGQGTPSIPLPGAVSSLVLFDGPREKVSYDEWQAHAVVDIDNRDGLELLIVKGSLIEDGETLARATWLRLPPSQPLKGRAGPEGLRIWRKTGPLHIAAD